MMKRSLFIVTILTAMFIAGCTSTKNQKSLEAPASNQRIQQLQKNDNYIPWWKR